MARHYPQTLPVPSPNDNVLFHTNSGGQPNDEVVFPRYDSYEAYQHERLKRDEYRKEYEKRESERAKQRERQKQKAIVSSVGLLSFLCFSSETFFFGRLNINRKLMLC